LGVVFAVGESLGWPMLREPLRAQLAKQLNVPVVIEGDFALRLLPPSQLSVGSLKIGAGDGFETPYLLQAKQVELGWHWRDLWCAWRGDRLRLQKLHVGVIDANLIRTADGRASWQVGGKPTSPPAGPDGLRGDLPLFGSLRIDRGRIVYSDAFTKSDLEARIEGGERAGAQPSGTGDTAKAGYTAQVQGRFAALPLRLTLRAGSVLPLVEEEAKGTDASHVSLQVDGEVAAATIHFSGSAGALLASQRLDGEFVLKGPSLGSAGDALNLTLPRTAPFELKGRLAHDGQVWSLRGARAALGRSRIGGDFAYDLSAKQLSGRLTGSVLAFADLAPSIGAEVERRPRTDGRVLPQRELDLPSLRAMNADLALDIDELHFASPGVLPLRGLQGRVLLQDGVLRLQDLKAQAGGGRFTATSTLDSNARPAAWTLDLGFDGVDVQSWLSGLGTGSKAPAPTAWITGMLSGRAALRGDGRSTAQILSNLQGRANANLSNGTMSHLLTEAAGLDIAQALGVAIRGDRPLPLNCARFDVIVLRGVATTQVAVLETQDSLIRIAGQVNLGDESLNLKATVLPKDFSLLTLRSPVTVAGTLGQPKVSVDGPKIAGKVLAAVALGAVVGPLAAVLPLIDPGESSGTDCAERAPGRAVETKSNPASRRRGD
jgi:uncharacterized protein involved in outer membrane biogenesis